jgi:CubicO group peptidase (beta-lactamase class C family)
LNPLLETVRKDAGLPALGAGAVKGGDIVAVGTVGIRRAGHPETVTLQDKFHIGSCTKAMTATIAATFVEQGKPGWDSTLAAIFPERRARMNAAFVDVTLELLLTHRGGLAHDGDSYGDARATITEQRLAYMDAILAKPPAHEIGTFHYSNAGYIIAGAMLERVSGKSWEELMRERLFTPLGMKSAGFGAPAHAGKTDQPWGHIFERGKYVPRYGDNPPALGPAGTIHCGTEDYLKFAALHASGGRRPAGIISEKSCAKLHQPAKNDYAMGWGVVDRSWARGKALTHAGSNTMNYFVVWLAPTIDFALAVATNAAGDEVPSALDKVAAALVKKFTA